MSKKLTCSVVDCSNDAFTRSWCRSHYKRWLKHKSPTGGRIKQGAARQYLVEFVLPFKGENCLFWPFGRDSLGYGRIWDGAIKKAENVNRVVCEALSGPPPEDHVAAHSCGMGRDGCVNPRHLRWATHKENSADTKEHRLLGIGRFKRTTEPLRQVR